VDIGEQRGCEVFGVCVTQKLCEIKIGDILMEESKLKEEDIEKLDHLSKKDYLKE